MSILSSHNSSIDGEKGGGAVRRVLGRVGWGVLVALLVAVAVGGVVVVLTSRGGEKSLGAKAGDCLAGEASRDMRRVACTEPDARWIVAGVVTGKSRNE